MQPPERFAELLDFGFGQIFLVLGLAQLFGNVFEVAENAFEHFAHAFHFRANFPEDGSAGARAIGLLVANRFRAALAAAFALLRKVCGAAAALMRAREARTIFAPPVAVASASAAAPVARGKAPSAPSAPAAAILGRGAGLAGSGLA